MSEVADKLREARELIAKGWTQGEYARGKSGRQADPTKRAAVCFCAAGAIGAANHKWPHSGLLGMKELARAVGGDGYESDVLEWNDDHDRTQADVLAAFDKAIELAESTGVGPRGGRAVPDGLSQAEPEKVSALTGFDPSRIRNPMQPWRWLSRSQVQTLESALLRRDHFLSSRELCGCVSSSPDSLWRLGFLDKTYAGIEQQPRYKISRAGIEALSERTGA